MYRLKLSMYALAMTLMFTTGAFAHDPRDRDDNGYGSPYDQARSIGYRDGYQHGAYDRSSRRGYNYKSDDWKHGDHGYRGGFGSKGQYKQSYRDAYMQGYNDGFYGRGGAYGGPYNNGRDRRYGDDDDRQRGGDYGRYGDSARDVAYDFGFRDGVYYAQKDLSAGRRANPEHCKGYKDADHGYDHRYDRDDFKRSYREAFIRGYNQTYFGR